ncbi:DUF58 domain-containing protein [Aureliella helgolandensis]|uniref:DUF58 domain-containing protein n=1 Tax=Aureliella helgolandensis TaxID=2527968 RepID=A0A518FZS9_9BACT|nr:DUF58 domain-containing protein [Aureliella helgolandensis]QDV21841.1 hypothetical protein Q31a_01200 [Aureliella helgolandensis]
MVAVEQYLKPELAAQIKRLDLRAQMVVRGFMQGLHASPFHGFSVEFSEHRRYAPGDDPKDLDWVAYAKTGKYYIKKFESETNLTGYLAIDLSQSMDYTYRQKLTKLDYSICLAAALCYLMVQQQDPVGLVTFDTALRASVPPRSRRSQLPAILSQLTKLKVAGQTDLAGSLTQLAAMLRHRSLVMLFSDLLSDEDTMLKSLRNLRHAGHDIIIFHVLDEAEVSFPFEGMVQLRDPETGATEPVRAADAAEEYRKAIQAFRTRLAKEFSESRIDYVPLDTSLPYDKALMEYLLNRRNRF